MRYVALIRDVSERVRLQSDLLHAERLATLGTTAAMLAHEIGNPLNGISLNVSLLARRLSRSGATDGRRRLRLLSTVNADIERLGRLLAEVRGYSRHLRLELRRTRVTQVVEDVLRLQVLGGHIQVERSFGTKLPEIVADTDKLKQVFLNLFKNAVEAMPEGGILTIRGEPRERDVVVQVIDTGSGIAEGVDPFQPFRTTKRGGNGPRTVHRQGDRVGPRRHAHLRESGRPGNHVQSDAADRRSGRAARRPARPVGPGCQGRRYQAQERGK